MRSRSVKILTVVVAICVVYLAWRLVAAPAGVRSEAAADTMCLASRIGLPCADP
jgi:hypothetical protein